MKKDRRNCKQADPAKLRELLSDMQLKALPGIEYAGWELVFLRQPLFQEPVAVIYNPDDGRTAVLDVNGNIGKLPRLSLRREQREAQVLPRYDPMIWAR